MSKRKWNTPMNDYAFRNQPGKGRLDQKPRNAGFKRLPIDDSIEPNGSSEIELGGRSVQRNHASEIQPSFKSHDVLSGAPGHANATHIYVHDAEALYDSEGQKQFLRAMLEMKIKSLSFDAFGRLVRKVLMYSGYSSVRACGEGMDRKTSGEGGIDLLAFSHTDLSTNLTAIQLKMHRQPVPSRCVDELRGVKGRFKADALLMVSTAPYSAWTRKVAAWPGEPPVQLIDIGGLTAMMLEKRLGVRAMPQGDGSGVRYVYDAEFFVVLEPAAPSDDLSKAQPLQKASNDLVKSAS